MRGDPTWEDCVFLSRLGAGTRKLRTLQTTVDQMTSGLSRGRLLSTRTVTSYWFQGLKSLVNGNFLFSPSFLSKLKHTITKTAEDTIKVFSLCFAMVLFTEVRIKFSFSLTHSLMQQNPWEHASAFSPHLRTTRCWARDQESQARFLI